MTYELQTEILLDTLTNRQLNQACEIAEQDCDDNDPCPYEYESAFERALRTVATANQLEYVNYLG